MVTARAEVDRPVGVLGWSTARELGDLSPVHRSLVAGVATLIRLGHPWDAALMAPYARLMHQAAVRELDLVETYPSEAQKARAAVADTLPAGAQGAAPTRPGGGVGPAVRPVVTRGFSPTMRPPRTRPGAVSFRVR